MQCYSWEEVQNGEYPDTWWKENLRMSRDTFVILCRELQPHNERQEARMRQPIVIQARVAFTIWRLATIVEYWTLSELFGIGRSTICTTVIETCNTIATHLFLWYVCFPTSDHLQSIITNFETCRGFPDSRCYWWDAHTNCSFTRNCLWLLLKRLLLCYHARSHWLSWTVCWCIHWLAR